MKFPAIIAAILGLSLASPASAAILGEALDSPAPTESAAPAPTPALTIATETQEGEDERIAARITGIFSELPGLADIGVEVEAGVVTLSGTVADVAAIDRAEGIAGRVSGVVTVENRIRRDLSVEGGLGTSALRDRADSFVQMLPLAGVSLVVALIIAAIGYALASLTGLWRRITPNSFLAELIASAVRFIFVIGGIVVALDMMGAGTLLGAVLGGAGVIGIALGFAMRDTVENYVASLMLSVRQPFRANDWVVIDSHEGRVIRLTSRATILMTLDGNHLRIPNSQVFKAVILNFTRNPQRRFEFDIGIDADDDPTEARHLGVDVLRALDFVLDSPEPQARVEAVGDSNIVIKFLGWIDQEKTDWYKAKSRAIPAVKNVLEQAGFAIPEPIYRLRIDPRSAPMTTEAAKGSVEATGSVSARPAASSSQSEEADVTPTDEVTKMVEAERAMEPGEKDLLDSRRPVE